MSDTKTAPETPLSEPTATVSATKPAPIATASMSNAAARLDDIWPEIVVRWLADTIHNSPVARSTEALNHLTASLPALRQALVETI